MTAQPLTCGTRLSADPTGQRQRNRGGGSHDGNPVELADGGFSGDDDGTYVTSSTLRVD